MDGWVDGWIDKEHSNTSYLEDFKNYHSMVEMIYPQLDACDPNKTAPLPGEWHQGGWPSTGELFVAGDGGTFLGPWVNGKLGEAEFLSTSGRFRSGEMTGVIT